MSATVTRCHSIPISTRILFHLLIFYLIMHCHIFSFFFFFNDTATTEIYTLSLHDALPICRRPKFLLAPPTRLVKACAFCERDRKSTRLNSSHLVISYAVFCLKKKKK